MALAPKTKRKPTTHHKKRQAAHHRQSKHYLKAYFPYLPMLAIVLVGLVVNTVWSLHSVLGSVSDFSSSRLLEDTNAQRASGSESALTINAQLTAAAQSKADDMVARDYWAHNTPDGKTPWSFIEAAGYSYQRAGENLAYGFDNADDTVTGWMNSAEHRANILNADYSEVGFGVASSDNYQGKGPEIVVVAEYGQPIPAAANITFSVPSPAATAGAETVPAAASTSPNPAPNGTPAATGSTPAAIAPKSAIEPSTRLVSRIQLLTGGQAPWSVFAVSLLMTTAVLVFVVRHGLRLKRLLTQGEVFVSHHPLFDVAVVLIATAGFVLTRAGGLIR